ncbi:lysozyme-like domain-containing protein [Aspergillus pseudodeflectus]|uniref:Lysozyme-like domain-containing protein n=1 Tax=Aspergillus pseudodeflectus TaxID=176178 RepID=A0ABR4JVZ4_9EURO
MHRLLNLLLITIFFLTPFASAACPGPSVNPATLKLLKTFEPFKPSVSDNGYGNPTVGYGHLCTDWPCSDISDSFPQPLSEESASRLLVNDLATYQNALTNVLSDAVTLNENQYGALVSWTYNAGIEAMEKTTLVARLNDGGDVALVGNGELPKWIYVNGTMVNGLARRRKAEVKLFNRKSQIRALPVAC